MHEIIRPGTVPPAVAFLAGFSGAAHRTMAQSLRVLAALLAAGGPPVEPGAIPWATLERAHVRRLRELLSERYAPATAKRHFAALRGVLREAGNPAANEVRGPKGESAETGRALDRGEIGRLFAACRDTYRGRQRAAILACGLYAGLRRFEIAALDLGDLTGAVLRVERGKGRKGRLVVLAPRAVEILGAWIEARGAEPGPLFYGARPGTRLGASTVAARLASLGRAAGVAFTPHDLRRTFITRILEATGGDLATAQKLAGHASIETTRRYDKRAREIADAVSAALTYEEDES